MTKTKYKLYGFTSILGFPCLCYGSKGIFAKVIWSKKYKWFRFYKGHTDADGVIHNITNASRWKFFGLAVITKEEKGYEETDV